MRVTCAHRAHRAERNVTKREHRIQYDALFIRSDVVFSSFFFAQKLHNLLCRWQNKGIWC